MSSRMPLQQISTNTLDYSSIMYDPYCCCGYCENEPIYMENDYQISDMNSNSIPIHSTLSVSIDSKKKSTRRSKHIPHHLRPQSLVERRNRRERLRVQDVNQAFHTLQQLLPFHSNLITQIDHKQQLDMTLNSASRISKVQTLRKAVDYIEALQNMLNENN